jgi:hypothetical protein
MKKFKEYTQEINEASQKGLDELVKHIEKIGKQTSYKPYGTKGTTYTFNRDKLYRAHVVHDHIEKLDPNAKFDAVRGVTNGKYKGHFYSVSVAPKHILLQTSHK